MSDLKHSKQGKSVSSSNYLHDALDKNHLAHAILMHGQDIGMLEEIVFSLSSKLLNCSTKQVSDHPDFFSLRPLNKMRQISVDKTRELIQLILKSPNQGERKVSVIYEADRMNKSAANAFLKTLEEPPLNTTIFLLTSRPYALLDTIRSRCLNFRLSSLSSIIEDLVWQEWLNHYKEWVAQSFQKPSNKKETANRLMSIYRLISQFESILSRLTEETWKKEKSSLPAGLSEEEELAQKSSVDKKMCHRLFTEIQVATYSEIIKLFPSNPPINKLNIVIEKLENCTSLTEVNLQIPTILETFFLYTLRTLSS